MDAAAAAPAECTGCAKQVLIDVDDDTIFGDLIPIQCPSCRTWCHVGCLVETEIRNDDCPLCVLVREPHPDANPRLMHDAQAFEALKAGKSAVFRVQETRLAGRMQTLQVQPSHVVSDGVLVAEDDLTPLRQMNGFVGSCVIDHVLIRLAFALGDARSWVLPTSVARGLFAITDRAKHKKPRVSCQAGLDMGLAWHDPERLGALERVILPVNVNANHWVLLVVEISGELRVERVVLFDSLLVSSSVPRTLTRVESALAGFLAALLHGNGGDGLQSVVPVSISPPAYPIPRQTGTDCGIFMLGYALLTLLRSPQPLRVAQSDIAQLRTWFVALISVPVRDACALEQLQSVHIGETSLGFDDFFQASDVATSAHAYFGLTQQYCISRGLAFPNVVLRLLKQYIWRTWLQRTLDS